MRAEVRALRAQISPHFIYNSLGAIASFVRTDPDRARDLLLEFADFTRYSFRQHGEFTTLAEELRSVERYLLLEQARFGDRLRVTLQVAPEVLGVNIPFLCLQPLVENAVQHGLEAGRRRRPHLHRGARRRPRVRDLHRGRRRRPGPRADPATCSPAAAAATSVGLANVDERLRATFGDEYGLVVETAPGAGTKVVVRVPKFAPGARPHERRRQQRPPRAGHRRRAPRARRADLPAGAATNGSRRCTPPTPPPRRCGCCSSSRSTRSSSTSRCPGSPASSSPRCSPASGRRPPRSSSPPTTSTPWTPSSSTRSTTCSSRFASERLAEAVRRVLAAARTRGPRGAGAGRARWRHPLRADLADPLRRGRGRLRPAAHRRQDSHLLRAPLTQLEQDWADAGFVRIHRSILIATGVRRRGPRRRRPVLGGRSAATSSRSSRRHTRELRDLLVRNARPGTESRT